MVRSDASTEPILPTFDPRFGDVCVLGLGKSGMGVATFCARAISQGNPVVKSLTIYAGRGDETTRRNAEPFLKAGIPVHFDTEDVEGLYDTCIPSPGIPLGSDFYRSGQKASAQTISEPEMAYLLSPRNWIAITGTNGKTTTTTLTAHLLRSAGIKARTVGNIGDPCIDAVCDREEGEYFVAELSSFQLASVKRFSPYVAMLLNITPDHVEWHGSHQAYVDAKMKLFDNLQFDALAILDITNPDAYACAGILESKGDRVLAIDTQTDEVGHDEAGVHDGRLYVSLTGFGTWELCTVDELPIKGTHNVSNALAAAAAALYCDADLDSVVSGLKSFQPLEHRIELAGKVDGVEYYDDSKATNVDASCKALSAFGDRPLIMLLGGHDKGTDLTGLVAACMRRCKAVVVFGEAGSRFLEAFSGKGDGTSDGCTVMAADHMADALSRARGIAVSGDVVCLSPACSSFDEFSCFEERGEVFKSLVGHLEGDRT